MNTASYTHRRGEIETYFDRTAAAAWARLTSDAPVGRIRATVRAGRDQMRATLLSWLPADLRGQRLLDAGCGTGALAVAAARRGAQVLAVDLSPTLVALAQERLPTDLGEGSVTFASGDMLAAEFGDFDHVVAMDSIIHYEVPDAVKALAALGSRCRGSMLFTFAPRTPLLATMHALGRLFPRGERSPALTPMQEAQLRALLAADPALAGWQAGQTRRVASGFYTSQALQWIRQPA
jgi:magnesium-protoporphyrin O-methyltransferase